MTTSEKKLVLTTVLEKQGGRQLRLLAKIQSSSLLRSLFGGLVVVERNFPEPLFPIERVGLRELEETIGDFLPKNVQQRSYKARVESAVRHAEAASEYDWVIFCDADVVPLRNWDHLFERQGAEVLISQTSDGYPDAGFFAVKGEAVVEFVNLWQCELEETVPPVVSEVQPGIENQKEERRTDELALRKVLDTEKWKVKKFERGEVVRAFDEGVGMGDVLEAAVVHLAGASLKQKTKLAFGLHMMWVYGDDDGLFLDILEG